MSESTPTFLLLVIAVILALLVGSFAFFMYNSNKESANSAVEKANRMATQMEESEWTQYEGTTITGSEVLAVIKHMKDTGTYVSVDNGGGEVTYIYTDSSLGTAQTSEEFANAIAAAKNRGDSKYINPSTRFVGEIDRDPTTEAIKGIKFTKAGTTPATP